MIQLETKWAKEIQRDNILAEYPRPNMVRDSYFNLNGEWNYCIHRSEDCEAYDGIILVPFSPETKLSGVEKIVKAGERLHYRKKFVLPKGFQKDRVILHFGAVDQECEVGLNGVKVGTHKGGYLAFSFEVTDYLIAGENVLTLTVKDDTEQSPHARGKQRVKKPKLMSSLFYTPQSGIWKTVWMESVPQKYIVTVKITPLYDESAVQFFVKAEGHNEDKNERNAKVEIIVFDAEKIIAQVLTNPNENTVIQLGDFKAWTPDTPHLYDVKITYGEDEVKTYFGMRKFSVNKDKNGILRFFLNNKPFFFNGVLDQGYWPESLMSAPTDEALLYDIQKLKDLGYNTIRKHIKVEPERFYYHCDRLGMMVWQDMPNGGGDYSMLFVTVLPNVLECAARGIKDKFYGIFKRKDKAGREQYYEDLQGMIDQLYNHPSIAAWVLFNEGWGQFDAKKATKLARSVDNTRFINEACGWFDQKGGDMFTIHNYLRKLKVKPDKNRVVALTEFGGYAFPILGHMACEKEFGYKHYRTKEELTQSYGQLWEEQIYPNLGNGLSAAIYTQTSDIEEEINGLMTYDREVSKFEEEILRDLHARLLKMFQNVTE